MPTIREILQHSQRIETCIQEWGFYYPRLFKSKHLKEMGNLNILVNIQPDGNIYHFTFLQRELENILECPVYIFLERQLEEEAKALLLEEAIALNKPEELLAYYGEDYEFSSVPSHSSFDLAHGQIILQDFKRQRLAINSDKEGSIILKHKQPQQKEHKEVSEDDRRVIELFKIARIPVDVSAELSKYDETDQVQMSLKQVVRSQLESQVKNFLKIQYTLQSIASLLRVWYDDREISNNLFDYCETLRKKDQLTGDGWQRILFCIALFLYEQNDQFPERKNWLKEDELKLKIKKLYDHHSISVYKSVERLVQLEQAEELSEELTEISQAIEEGSKKSGKENPGNTDFFEKASSSSSTDKKRKYSEFIGTSSSASEIDTTPRSKSP